ncbi:unnamed protein product, partial [Staurois parvus]
DSHNHWARVVGKRPLPPSARSPARPRGRAPGDLRDRCVLRTQLITRCGERPIPPAFYHVISGVQ